MRFFQPCVSGYGLHVHDDGAPSKGHNCGMSLLETAQALPGELLIVTTTLPARDAALRLAREAVGARLAACAQVDEAAITSVYHWQGEMCEEPEWRLSFKTVAARADALHRFVVARHPYAVPQWVVVRARTTTPYGQWVTAETAGDDKA